VLAASLLLYLQVDGRLLRHGRKQGARGEGQVASSEGQVASSKVHGDVFETS
jgi:hypothetical protein